MGKGVTVSPKVEEIEDAMSQLASEADVETEAEADGADAFKVEDDDALNLAQNEVEADAEVEAEVQSDEEDSYVDM